MNQFDSLLERRDWKRGAGENVAHVLGEMPVFSTVGKRRLRRIARDSEVARFVPGDVVTREGDAAEFFQVVLEGEAEVRGKPRRIRRGDHFGGSALLGAGSSAATVVAADDLTVMRLPRGEFLELVRENPRLALAILRELAQRDTGTFPHAA